MLISVGDAWNDLFVMAGGAAAALAGLLFVAVSLNHEQILRGSALPLLAAQSVAVLIGVVAMSVAILVPDQRPQALGVELLVIGVVLAVILLVPTIRHLGELTRLNWKLRRLAVSVVSVAPLLVGAVLLAADQEAGLAWAALEVVAAIVVATYNAWILLVEIRR